MMHNLIVDDAESFSDDLVDILTADNAHFPLPLHTYKGILTLNYKFVLIFLFPVQNKSYRRHKNNRHPPAPLPALCHCICSCQTYVLVICYDYIKSNETRIR